MRCSAVFWMAFIEGENGGLKFQTDGVCSILLGAGAKKAAQQRVPGLRRKDCAGWLPAMPAAGLRDTGDCGWLAAEGAWDVNKGVVLRWELMNTWCGCLVIIPLLIILSCPALQQHLQNRSNSCKSIFRNVCECERLSTWLIPGLWKQSLLILGKF